MVFFSAKVNLRKLVFEARARYYMIYVIAREEETKEPDIELQLSRKGPT